MTNNLIYKLYVAQYSEEQAIAEVLRQTERHLEEQQRLTSAADQRAVAFASVLIVVVGILLGSIDGSTIGFTKPFVVAGFIIAISAAFFSARPTRIYGSGADSKTLENHVGEGREGYMLITLIKRNDRNILHNDRVLKRSAWIFRFALTVALLAALALVFDWADIGANLQDIRETDQ